MFPRWVGLIAVFAVTAIRALAVEATLIADTHVNSARPTANSGTVSNLNAGAGYTTLLQFDLDILPPGTTAAQVSRAVLRLYCNRADTPGAVTLQAVTSPWGEYSVTFASLPAVAASSQSFPVSRDGVFLSIDVTALVQGWITTPSSNNGIALASDVAAVQFDSKENDLTGHAPALDVALVSQGPAGAKGDTGSAGPAGPQGPIGVKGDIGVAGPPGPAGLKGDPGSPGVPGSSGPAGEQGPQGPKGDTGPMGPQGLKGEPGLAGSTGAQGPAGSPGLVYRGPYTATTAYAQGDVVLSGSTSFVSLADGNYGIAPESGAPWWGVLAAQGEAGPQGPAGVSGPPGVAGPAGVQGLPGAQGAPGSQGPAGTTGATGAQGPVGPQGPAGAQGPIGLQGSAGTPGVTGAIGPAGPQGTQGPAGPVGMSFRGAFSPSTNYAAGDGVSYDGAGYVSLINGNLGNVPDQSPATWGKFAAGTQGPVGAQGPIGLQGPAGPPGVTGAIGPAGPQGTQGPAGPVGMSFRGAFSPSTNYAVGDGVSYDGAGYVSLINGNLGNVPDQSPAVWGKFAAGTQGPVGAAGPQGPIGPAGSTGATGSPGLAGAAGPAGPQGPQGIAGSPGPAGAQGLQGPAGVIFKGAWSSETGYLANDAVSYDGSTYLALQTSLGARPDITPSAWAMLAQAGSAGATGPAGAPATVSIGTVATTAPGSPATVTNSGSATAAVLNFTLPQGAAGASGGGGSGNGWNSFGSMYHSVSFNTNFYSVSNPNANVAENETVLTWVPAGCTATTLAVYSQQGNAIKVTMRLGSSGAMVDTELSCSVSTGSSCTSTGSVAVPAGSFIDLQIASANGKQAGVWTAVGCN